MLDPVILDEVISEHTANSLRDMLQNCKLSAQGRAYLIAAIYYLEGTDNA